VSDIVQAFFVAAFILILAILAYMAGALDRIADAAERAAKK
jgi:hypothetical protein